MYNRAKVSELFCLSIERIKKKYKSKYTIKLHAVVSEEASKNVCVKYGATFTECENFPIGNKWNAGLLDALNRFDFDYVLIMGDDDIMSNDLLRMYSPYIRRGEDYFGVNSIYFYSPSMESALSFEYKDKGNKLMGCGRMISRKAITKAGYQIMIEPTKNFCYYGISFIGGQPKTIPLYQAEYLQKMNFVKIISNCAFQLWSANQNNGLDMQSEMNLLFNGFPPLLIETDKPLITDVKTEQNIWKFTHFIKTSKAVDNINTVTEFWSRAEKDFVQVLR